MLPQASSHQIHAAHFSSQQEASSSGVKKCGHALATKNVECVNVFYLLYFIHMNAVWQSLYVCATKNCCALLTFTEHFAPLV